jgi:hypothetical protein
MKERRATKQERQKWDEGRGLHYILRLIFLLLSMKYRPHVLQKYVKMKSKMKFDNFL